MQIVYLEKMVAMRNSQFSEIVMRSLYSVSTMLEQNETKYFLDKDLAEAEQTRAGAEQALAEARAEAERIARASFLAMEAGADFIKTSTGKIAVNATPEATFIMCNAIKVWREKTGVKMGYKPAGGVSTTEEAVQHYTLVKEVLGQEWLNNESFRFGASRLANNLLSSIVGKETKHF